MLITYLAPFEFDVVVRFLGGGCCCCCCCCCFSPWDGRRANKMNPYELKVFVFLNKSVTSKSLEGGFCFYFGGWVGQGQLGR